MLPGIDLDQCPQSSGVLVRMLALHGIPRHAIGSTVGASADAQVAGVLRSSQHGELAGGTETPFWASRHECGSI